MKKIILLIIILSSACFSQNFWEQTNIPDISSSTYVRSIIITSNNNLFAATNNMGGLFYSSDYGKNWQKMNNDLEEAYISSLVLGINGDVYAGTYNKGVLRSTDNGNNWLECNNGITDFDIESLAINKEGEIFAAISGKGIFRSSDNGENWIEVNNGLTQVVFNMGVRNISINSKGHVFALIYYGGVFRSTDNGNNWTQIINGFSIDGHGYYSGMSLTIDSNDDLFAGTLGVGIFRSTDNGNSWIAMNNGLIVENQVQNSLVINAEGDIFVGVYDYDKPNIGGVYCSKDKGESWLELGNELKIGVRCLAISPNGYIFAGTYGSGVYKSLYSITSIENIDFIPSAFELHQNYPNPFNPVTTIQYKIISTTKVVLKIYDVLGREVITLINEEKMPGNYEIKFNGSNLSSGVYFYRMQTNEFIETKKLVLLK